MTPKTPTKTAPSSPRRFGPRALAAPLCTSLAITLAASVGAVALTQTAHSEGIVDTAMHNPPTPRSFKGYAFDQCQAPKQSAMNMWMKRSPYLGIGIYISGADRACRVQNYLNATWVHTQLSHGWRLLPITVGPQASCNPHFPRYPHDRKIDPKPGRGSLYPRARAQGRGQAAATVRTARRLGISRGSTMYYDLESFNTNNTGCRESALSFLSAWTLALHRAGYHSGVYSSARSGISALVQARAQHQRHLVFPDQIWIAEWDHRVNTASSYVTGGLWSPHRRIKQFQGGHNETYGHVTINIDRDFVDVGRGMYAPKVVHCGGVDLNLSSFAVFNLAARHPNRRHVKAVQCLLHERGLYGGRMNGRYTSRVRAAVHRWKTWHHWRVDNMWYREDWVSLLASRRSQTVKFGSANENVRFAQRALDAANPRLHLAITGTFGAATRTAVRAYQHRAGVKPDGIVTPGTWNAMQHGKT